jgi:hypothetical protein
MFHRGLKVKIILHLLKASSACVGANKVNISGGKIWFHYVHVWQLFYFTVTVLQIHTMGDNVNVVTSGPRHEAIF